MIHSSKIFLRWLAASILTTTGRYQATLAKLASNGKSVILMYHRVLSLDRTDEYIEPGMYVTPTTFQMHLSLLNQYFTMVSLEEIVNAPEPNTKKPKCAITFDDGWVDFYINAFPIIKKSSVPVTVFLPTDYIGTTRWFWTDRIADILKIIQSVPNTEALKTDSYLISRIEELTGTLFDRIDNAIKLLKPCPLEQIHKIVQELENRAAISPEKRQRAFLNWAECRELRASGLVTFGSHTAHHIIMTAETEIVCTQELTVSRQKLIDEQVVNPAFTSFCYPNGGYSSQVAQLVENAGYNCAVTTKHGYTSVSGSCYALNRVGIHQDMTSHKALMLSRILT